jgi:two-component system cell cycle sensor histidine kinase/response regulator CckA
VLLVLLAAAGMVLFFWMSRAARAQAWRVPERAIAAGADGGRVRCFCVIEALDEAALITDGNLSPIVANTSYLTIAELTGILGDSDRPPMMSRLFGADPMLSAPMFRLSKAAQLGQSRREDLPATGALSGKHTRYEASVGPMPGGHVCMLARDRRGVCRAERRGERATALPGRSPVGFCGAPDGAIVYMNRSLRSVLLGDDPSLLRVKDIVKKIPRLMRRDRRGFRRISTRLTLRGIDGQGSSGVALSFWPAEHGRRFARSFLRRRRSAGTDSHAARKAPRRMATYSLTPFGVAVLDGIDLPHRRSWIPTPR